MLHMIMVVLVTVLVIVIVMIMTVILYIMTVVVMLDININIIIIILVTIMAWRVMVSLMFILAIECSVYHMSHITYTEQHKTNRIDAHSTKCRKEHQVRRIHVLWLNEQLYRVQHNEHRNTEQKYSIYQCTHNFSTCKTVGIAGSCLLLGKLCRECRESQGGLFCCLRRRK